MNELKERIGKAREYIENYIASKNLSERDRRAIVIAGIAVALFFLFFIVSSFTSGSSKSRNQVAALREQLKEVKTLVKKYEYSKSTLQEITRSIKKEDEALISVVETIMVENQIDRNTFSINDSNSNIGDSDGLYNERAVQVDINRIPLEKAIDILYAVQSRKSFLKVSNLRLKTRFDKTNLLDVSFRLSTFEFNKVI